MKFPLRVGRITPTMWTHMRFCSNLTMFLTDQLSLAASLDPARPLFCLSACVTPPGLWTALQSLEYGSSTCLQTFSKAVRRCVMCYLCVCVLCASIGTFQVMVACLLSAGSCQKRFREDVGSDDRDLIKRMKGDFDRYHCCFRDSQLDQII